MASFELRKVKSALRRVTNDRVIANKRVLRQSGKVASGSTLKSINPVFNFGGIILKSEIKANISFNYIKFGRAGRNPKSPNIRKKSDQKMPPKGSLLAWMRIRGIEGSAEFVIRRAIAIFGIEPLNIDDMVNKLLNKIEIKRLEAAGRNELVEIITKEIKQTF